MSDFTRFKPKFTAGQQRYHLSNANTIPGYVKASGQAISQSTYSNLYARVGNISDGNIFATWTIRTSVTSTAGVAAAAYLGDYFIYLANDIGTSTDAITFVNGNTNMSEYYNLTYGAGIYMVVGEGKTQVLNVLTSTNAINWTTQTSASATSMQSVTYGSVFAAAGWNGSLQTSTNGVTWTVRTSGTTSSILALAYGDGIYVYGGNGGVLATSTNAITWTARTSGTTSAIKSLIYGNGIYVYGGNGGTLATSTNAITWTARTSGTTSTIHTVNYFSGMNLYWYGGVNTVIASSTDAITWTARTTGGDKDINGLAYGKNGAIGNYNNMIFSAGGNSQLLSAVVTTYDLTQSFIVPSTVNFTYTYLNTTPSTHIKADY